MTIIASDPIKKASIIMNDVLYERWPVSEWIGWLNDAIGEIGTIRPAALAVTEVVQLAAGSFQTLPDGAQKLLDVVRNIGPGNAPGRPVRLIDRGLLDDNDPNWYASSPDDSIMHYSYDERSPTTFYNYPPCVAGTKVECLYAKTFLVAGVDEATALQVEIPLSAEYTGPIVNYLVSRAKGKDSEYGAQEGLAYMQAFMSTLLGSNQITAAASPNAGSA